jgi:hypothetical protein
MPSIIFQKDIVLDKVLFVNTWIELFCGGIIMALFFYLITQWIESKRKQQEDELILKEIISIFDETLKYFKNKELSKKTEMEFNYQTILSSINDVHDKYLKKHINQNINADYEDIKNVIHNLQSNTNTCIRESIINKIISNLKNYGKSIREN